MKIKDLKDLSREHRLQLVVRLWNIALAQRKFEDGITKELNKFLKKSFEDSEAICPKNSPGLMIEKWGNELLVSPGHEGKNNEWFSWFLDLHKGGKLRDGPSTIYIEDEEYKPKTILELAKIIL